jgi:hypothetical protein
MLTAGALDEPALRARDAIHVAAAIGLGLLDAFVSYDERQAAAASLRAAHGPAFRLLDALVVATAVVLDADPVITTNSRWPTLLVKVEVLVADGHMVGLSEERGRDD